MTEIDEFIEMYGNEEKCLVDNLLTPERALTLSNIMFWGKRLEEGGKQVKDMCEYVELALRESNSEVAEQMILSLRSNCKEMVEVGLKLWKLGMSIQV